MGKTYRREKNVWDDDPVRFERRSIKNGKDKFKMKQDSYQDKRRERNKQRDMEEYFSNES